MKRGFFNLFLPETIVIQFVKTLVGISNFSISWIIYEFVLCACMRARARVCVVVCAWLCLCVVMCASLSMHGRGCVVVCVIVWVCGCASECELVCDLEWIYVTLAQNINTYTSFKPYAAIKLYIIMSTDISITHTKQCQSQIQTYICLGYSSA